MDVAAARAVLGLSPQATRADAERAWKEARKPLLKELNRHEQGEEPPELLARLEHLEAAWRTLREALPAAAPAAASAAPATPPAAPAAPAPGAADEDTGSGSSRATTRPRLEPGTVLLERFEVRELLTHRPEGDGYRALDRVRGVEVVIKPVDGQLARHAPLKERVRQGVLAARHATHAHLARVLDLEPFQGTWLVVQELPPGEALWDRVHGRGEAAQPLPRAELLAAARDWAVGLAALHRELAHGALRPESLWWSPEAGGRVADAGFVAVQGALREKRLSRAKQGTAYWAPEQYRDETLAAQRADQYALALCLYEALSGRPAGGRTERIRRLRRDLPRRFTRALERALSTRPQRRFPDLDAFAEAAFRGHRSERARPAAVRPLSALLPLLLLLALLAGFVASPLGTATGGTLREAAERWRTAEAGVDARAVEWERLRRRWVRLDADREALDEAARAELDRLRGPLAGPRPADADRERIAAELAAILDQAARASSRGARQATAAALEAHRGAEAVAHARRSAAAEARERTRRAYEEAGPADRGAPLRALVTAAAALAREQEQAEQAAWARLGLAARRHALEALWDAAAALRVGDQAAAGRHHARAAAALGTWTEAAAAWRTASEAFDPLDGAAGGEQAAPDAERAGALALLLDARDPATSEGPLAPLLERLRAEAERAASARAWIHPAGAFTLAVGLGPLEAAWGGTWRRAAGGLELTLLVGDDRVAGARPPQVFLRRAEGHPTPGELAAALAEAPRGARAVWGAAPVDPPPPAELDPPALVVPGTEALVRGRLAGGAAGALVEGRWVEATDGRFEARTPLAPDLARTWLRVHAGAPPGAGPAALLPVRVDPVAPRVHLLAPADGTPVAPGAEVTVRAVIYDSTLARVLVAGAEEPLRPDDLYQVVIRTLTAPRSGALVLPVEARDAAGNTTRVEWTWPVR